MTKGFSKKLLAVGGIAAALIASFGLHSAVGYNDIEKVKIMTQKMMTVCVGRFSIDLPEGTEVRFTPARIAGVDIVSLPGYTELQMQSDVSELEETLALQKNEQGRPSLEKKLITDAINFKATVIYHSRGKPVPIGMNGVDVPGTEEGIKVQAFGIKDSVGYAFKARLASPRSEGNLLKVVNQFEALPADTVPAHPGFCVDQGIVRDPLTPANNESITMFATLKGHPDVAIRLYTAINRKRIYDSLLTRDAENSNKRDYASHFTSLRKGARVINGMPGDEVLDRVKEFNRTSGHGFMWEALGKMNDVLAPNVSLEIQTGKGRPGEPVNSSLSDDEVLELWDRISSSLRIRATSAGKGGQVTAPPNLALGELAATGRACPQTGYWECKEWENVVGGSRKFFREGEDMPHVILVATPSFWEKLSGESRSTQVATVWKLVDYGPMPSEDLAASEPSPNDGRDLPRHPNVDDPEGGSS